MTDYLFYPPADEAQDDIWQYTVDQWGEEQAEKYIIGLHTHLQALAKKQKLWRSLPSGPLVPSDLDMEVYFSKYEHHHIFFRTLSKGRIGIMSILHERSNIPVRLRKDLEEIEAQ